MRSLYDCFFTGFRTEVKVRTTARCRARCLRCEVEGLVIPERAVAHTGKKYHWGQRPPQRKRSPPRIVQGILMAASPPEHDNASTGMVEPVGSLVGGARSDCLPGLRAQLTG